MPASYAQAEATLVDVVHVLHEKYTTDTPAALTDFAGVVAAYNGDEDSEVLQLGEQIRSGEISTITGPMKRLLDRALLDMAHSAEINWPGTSVNDEMFVRIRQYLDDVGPYAGGSVDKDVTARGWTRGSPSLVSTPAMSVYRVTVDEYGQGIETGNPQVIRLSVESPVAQFPKKLRYVMGDAGRDFLDVQGTGGGGFTIDLWDYRNASANGLLQNPTLNHGVTAASALVTGDVANWTISGTVVAGTQKFRGLTSSIKLTADADYIEQTLVGQATRRTPYLLCLWVYPEASWNGTITVAWGSKSQAFTSLTASQWNLLVVDRDLDLYPEQWDSAANNRVRVTATTADTDFTVGMIQLAPMIRGTEGTWHFGVNGITAASPTDVALGATGTITDSLSVSGKINNCLARMYPTLKEAYFPITGSNAISDP